MGHIDESPLAGGVIRDRPVNPRLRGVLLAAAHAAGVDVVRVVSGGQPGSTGKRVGSRRHDGGGAADIELVRGGRTLNFTDAADLETIRRFVAAAAASGATGMGAGVNYMGPARLHVGFGNGPNDTARIVWGEGGNSANAPAWLIDAAERGWSGSAAVPAPADTWAPAPAAPERQPGELGAPPGSSVPGQLDSVAGGILRMSDRAGGLFGALTRAAIVLFQLLARTPATGLPDGTPGLVRYGAYVRAAGWLVAALGVVGLVKSLGGSSSDDYVQGLDRFRDMLGGSADPSVNQVFEIMKQVLAAAKPTIDSAARSAPVGAILAAIGDILPGAAASTAALAAGVALHQIGARIVRGQA